MTSRKHHNRPPPSVFFCPDCRRNDRVQNLLVFDFNKTPPSLNYIFLCMRCEVDEDMYECITRQYT